MTSMTIKATDQRKGMTMDEITDAIMKARLSGLDEISRTRVGFRYQILEMTFRKAGPKQ